MRLVIARPLLQAMEDAARAAYPLECCGLLVGSRDGGDARVARVVVAANVAPDSAHRFEVDPKVLLATYRAARDGGEEVLGPYHSHPDGEARPSATDTARARDVGAAGEAWLIVPVAKGVPGAPRAFVFGGESFAEATLEVVP